MTISQTGDFSILFVRMPTSAITDF